MRLARLARILAQRRIFRNITTLRTNSYGELNLSSNENSAASLEQRLVQIRKINKTLLERKYPTTLNLADLDE